MATFHRPMTNKLIPRPTTQSIPLSITQSIPLPTQPKTRLSYKEIFYIFPRQEKVKISMSILATVYPTLLSKHASSKSALSKHLLLKYLLFSVFFVSNAVTAAIPASTGPETVDVNFQHLGKNYHIQGKNVNNTYVFNAGAKKKVSLSTLEWAPYIGQNICNQGWVQQLTVALLVSQGYEVTISFYPWARTISMAEKGRVDILFPEYFIEPAAPSDVIKGTKRTDHLALSEPIPGGPIALLKRKNFDSPFKGNLEVLKGERIGVVRGYQNTPEFDALMDSDFFRIDNSVDDLMNAIKLSKNRINYIVGDPSVIFFSVKTGKHLSKKMKASILDMIEIVEPPLQYNNLYYAVSKKNPEWKTLLKTLNEAIASFKKGGVTQQIISDTKNQCNPSSS